MTSSATSSADRVLAARATGFAEARGVRAAVSPYLFRSMLVGMGAAAVVLDRTTRNRDLTWRFAKARARNLLGMLGVEVAVYGTEHVASGGPFVFAPNHQSHLDILSLLAHLPGRTRFAAKKSLWRHPVVAAVLNTLDMVPIDRDDPSAAVGALRRTDGTAGSLVVFPEGTRSRNGHLLPFKKGAFALAIEAGLPIVPVVCRGTRRLMPRGSRLTVVPGPVEVVIEAPLATAGLSYDDREDLAARTRVAIERHHTGW
jgi:1-acyl-sn-glycerol-3-phosphate acyltransferase